MPIIHFDGMEILRESVRQGVKYDAVITDIPYGVTQHKNDNLPDIAELFELVFKVTNVFITTCQGRALQDLLSKMPKSVKWHDLVWDKKLTSGFLNAKRQPLRRHENVLVMYKKAPTYNPQMWEGKPLHSKGVSYMDAKLVNQNYGKFEQTEDIRKGSTEKYPQSIIEFQKPHPSKAIHPTEKPVELYEWLIKTYTNEGDEILEPFAGSGTTCVACINTDRSYIACEIDEGVYERASERIKKAEETKC